ncbi:hypothetical protein [Streptomyces sp. NPDC052012]|uniref:hypothetical protein n=1 Tax=Streptomyces sp. NPDC052012 TaxID=3155051 RepID=UPI00344EB600
MSDEVSRALRELAQRHETTPPVPASEIRARAVRRSRRRRTTCTLAVAATAACVLATIVTTLHADPPDKNRHTPAAAPEPSTTRSATPATPLPADSLDLSRHTLTVGDRVLRVDSHSFDTLPPDRRLTVTAKREVMILPIHANAKTMYDVKIPYVVELRTTNRSPVYAGALTFDTKALSALDPKTGWLGMSAKDAKWFYTRVRVGDDIEITSTAPPGDGVAPSEGAGAPSTAP